MKKLLTIDKIKVIRNLDSFCTLISTHRNKRPSILLHSAISTSQAMNELLQKYKKVCYFGYFPDVFYKNLSEQVKLSEKI